MWQTLDRNSLWPGIFGTFQRERFESWVEGPVKCGTGVGAITSLTSLHVVSVFFICLHTLQIFWKIFHDRTATFSIFHLKQKRWGLLVNDSRHIFCDFGLQKSEMTWSWLRHGNPWWDCQDLTYDYLRRKKACLLLFLYGFKLMFESWRHYGCVIVYQCVLPFKLPSICYYTAQQCEDISVKGHLIWIFSICSRGKFQNGPLKEVWSEDAVNYFSPLSTTSNFVHHCKSFHHER